MKRAGLALRFVERRRFKNPCLINLSVVDSARLRSLRFMPNDFRHGSRVPAPLSRFLCSKPRNSDTKDNVGPHHLRSVELQGPGRNDQPTSDDQIEPFFPGRECRARSDRKHHNDDTDSDGVLQFNSAGKLNTKARSKTFDHFVTPPDLIRLIRIENIHYAEHRDPSLRRGPA